VNYNVTVDGIVIVAFEQSKWAGGQHQVIPNRLAARTKFTGINIKDIGAFLKDSHSYSGLPSYGIDSSGSLHLQSGFPIAPDFPVDLARRPLFYCRDGSAPIQANAWQAVRQDPRSFPTAARLKLIMWAAPRTASIAANAEADEHESAQAAAAFSFRSVTGLYDKGGHDRGLSNRNR
jgi:hypothetical protein